MSKFKRDAMCLSIFLLLIIVIMICDIRAVVIRLNNPTYSTRFIKTCYDGKEILVYKGHYESSIVLNIDAKTGKPIRCESNE